MADTMKAPYPPTATTASAPGSSPAKVIYVAPAADADTCECTAGWWMFGLGWWLTPFWAVGALLPFCSKGSRPNVRRNNRRAAIGSAVMLLLSIIAIVVVVVLVTRSGGRGTTVVTTTRWTSSSGGTPSISSSSSTPSVFTRTAPMDEGLRPKLFETDFKPHSQWAFEG